MRASKTGVYPLPNSELVAGGVARRLTESGAGEGIRTPDPLITNQMLYRLSYASRRKSTIIIRRNQNCKAAELIFAHDRVEVRQPGLDSLLPSARPNAL